MNQLRTIYKDALATFLSPLKAWFDEPDVSEIMVNSAVGVFVERKGIIEQVSTERFSERRLRAFVRNHAEMVQFFVRDSDSSYSGVLPACGSRFHVIWPPATSDNAFHLTIRKHKFGSMSLDQLHALNAIDDQQLKQLREHIECKSNILICGETGTGKTTFLNAILNEAEPSERIVVIEEIPEIEIDSHVNKVLLQTVGSDQDGLGAKSIRDLVRESLIMRPDRIILGECRGVEAIDMIQAMQTHRGCLATLHGRSIASARFRLETLMLLGQSNYSLEVAAREVDSSVDLYVQLTRQKGRRFVSAIQVS